MRADFEGLIKTCSAADPGLAAQAARRIIEFFKAIFRRIKNAQNAAGDPRRRSEELRKIQEEVEQFYKELSEQVSKRIQDVKAMQNTPEPPNKRQVRFWDNSEGKLRKTDIDVLTKYGNRLEKDKSLQELAEELGKAEEEESTFETEIYTETVYKPEWRAEYANKADLVGLQESDDISAMLPAEAALLCDPALETAFYQKFSEKKLQTYDYQAKTLNYRASERCKTRQKIKAGKRGPIIICVDTSGSMAGTPERVAKTLSFALSKIAARDGRKCYLISFSDKIDTLEIAGGSGGNADGDIDKLANFLSMSFDGGTDAAPALEEALRMLKTADYRNADVVMVSDFQMGNIDIKIQKKIYAAKKNKTRFHSIVINDAAYIKNLLRRIGIGGWNPSSVHGTEVMREFDSNWVYDPGNPKRVITLVKNIKENI
jgi:uncharacterized protein with von Willebrand factor type A (vWA) domain